MDTYFNNRALSYLDALDRYPTVLHHEYQTAVMMSDIHPGHTLLTIPSSCERINPYLPPSVSLIQYETCADLAKHTDIPLCEWGNIPVADQTVDRILSIASLHHCSDAERLSFYNECKRILKPDGKLIIGDVEKGTGLDGWLNTFVDKYNPYGHKGVFFTENDAPHGFITEIHRTAYPWIFSSNSEMIDFTKRLFMLECDDKTILDGISKYIPNYQMGLLYFICHQSAPSSFSISMV